MRKWKKKNRRIDDDACCKRIGYQRNQRPSDRPCGMGSRKNRRYGTVFSPGRSGGMSYQRRRAGFRETPLTLPETADNPVDAIVLSGGSAYGLAAADGVMRCLEKHDIGYVTPACRVPLVCQSCIFDLAYGSATLRPDASLGYEACERALQGTDGRMGNIGGGIEASVGKLYGMKRAMKSGFGIHSVRIGDLEITAAVIVNAFGDIVNPRDGKKIAGTHQ